MIARVFQERGIVRVEMSTGEARALFEALGDLPAKHSPPKAKQLFRELDEALNQIEAIAARRAKEDAAEARRQAAKAAELAAAEAAE